MSTTSELLQEIKQVAQVPDVSSSSVTDSETEVFTDAGILRIATRELRSWFMPRLVAQRLEFMVATKTYTITEANDNYRISHRAVGAKVKNVWWESGDSKEEIPLVPHSDVEYEDGFYIEGSRIWLRNGKSSGSLKANFYIRPSKLVATTRAGVIDQVTSSTVVRVTSVPSGMVAGTVVDIVKYTSPFEIEVLEATITNVNVTTITLDTGSDNIEVGDYVCFKEETPVVPVPYDLWPVLVQRTAMKIVSIIGDRDSRQRLKEELTEMEEGINILTSPRAEDRPRTVRAKKNIIGGR